MLLPEDCIEAGLPYDWTRLGIDSEKEKEIVRALSAATENHTPPTAAGRHNSAAPSGSERDKKAALSQGASGGQSIPAPAVGSCSGSATRVGAVEQRREGEHGGGSNSSDGTKLESPSQDTEILLNRSTDGNGVSSARSKATGGRVGGSKLASEIGRWDSVRLKEVKELAPDAEYWEIRMVLARLKSGWCG